MELPKIKMEAVKTFLTKHRKSTATVKRTRNHSLIRFENIIVEDIFFGRANGRANRTLFVQVSEVLQARRKTRERHHCFEVTFFSNSGNVQAIICTKCGNDKVNCSAMSTFTNWIQSIPARPGDDTENVAPNENAITPKTKECYVLIKEAPKESLTKKMTQECYVLVKKENISPNSAAAATEAPVLAMLKKEPVPITHLQLESAQKLSMVSLIREFEGSSAEEFLKFCTERMVQANSCSAVQFLTIEQADNDLWHELRKGRITASRMYDASRCTLLKGLLTNKIMGVSYGISFGMTRGTYLEGHVFAVLQKEYPGLRNTGLVLDPQFPWLGASPDGICEEFVLEIKCPLTQKAHDCYVDVSKLLKKYYAQIQLQMHMTHKTTALLGVAAVDFETSKHVTKVWIDYDKTYVDQIMAEAYEFWCEAVFKALLKVKRFFLRKRACKKVSYIPFNIALE